VGAARAACLIWLTVDLLPDRFACVAALFMPLQLRLELSLLELGQKVGRIGPPNWQL